MKKCNTAELISSLRRTDVGHLKPNCITQLLLMFDNLIISFLFQFVSRKMWTGSGVGKREYDVGRQGT